MKHGVPLIIMAVSYVLFCSSCSYDRKIFKDQLTEIEDVLRRAPDSALTAIRNIRPPSMDRHAARYALLYSKILDKNNIDIQNDSLISIALDYYPGKRKTDKAIETYYYAARVYENRQEYEQAIALLTRIDEIDDRVQIDPYLNALIHTTKGRIYQTCMDFDKSMSNYLKAADYYAVSGNEDRYASSMLRVADCHIKQKRYEDALVILDRIEKAKQTFSSATLNKYYQAKLYLCGYIKKYSPLETLESYLAEVADPRIIDWLSVASIHINYGDSSKAIEALQKQALYRGKNAAYHYRHAQANELKGEYKCAAEDYKKYISMSGQTGQSLLTQETRFIEERAYHNEMHEKARMKSIILLLICIVILLSLSLTICIIIAIRRQLQLKEHEHRELARQLDGLMAEREELARISTHNEEARKIISERLRIIDNFVFSDVLQDETFKREASIMLKGIISDREAFIRNNRLIFNQSYPSFIEFLQEMDLTEQEIEHCCLYAIGLNGKMATTFTNLKRHYHIGSSIRKKLGLNEHDTNISIHIKRLFKKFEESHC